MIIKVKVKPKVDAMWCDKLMIQLGLQLGSQYPNCNPKCDPNCKNSKTLSDAFLPLPPFLKNQKLPVDLYIYPFGTCTSNTTP